MSYLNYVGHICESEFSYIHVCGYEGANKILIQTEAGAEMKKLKLYKNNKGNYFNLDGKRVYMRY